MKNLFTIMKYHRLESIEKQQEPSHKFAKDITIEYKSLTRSKFSIQSNTPLLPTYNSGVFFRKIYVLKRKNYRFFKNYDRNLYKIKRNRARYERARGTFEKIQFFSK